MLFGKGSNFELGLSLDRKTNLLFNPDQSRIISNMSSHMSGMCDIRNDSESFGIPPLDIVTKSESDELDNRLMKNHEFDQTKDYLN